MMDKFLKWLKKKEGVWQNILCKKTINNIFFINEADDTFPITDGYGTIYKNVEQMLIGHMYEYIKELYENIDWMKWNQKLPYIEDKINNAWYSAPGLSIHYQELIDIIKELEKLT